MFCCKPKTYESQFVKLIDVRQIWLLARAPQNFKMFVELRQKLYILCASLSQNLKCRYFTFSHSVPVPKVFGPHGSVNQRYGSGSESFHHQAKIVRKIFIFNVLWIIYDFLSLKNDVNVPVKSKKEKNY